MWDHLGHAATIIQFLTAIPIGWALYLYISREIRYRKILKDIKERRTEKPAALAISLSGTDITNQVTQYVKNNIGDYKVYQFVKIAGVTQENINDLMDELLQIKREMTADGITEVHLFVMAPVAFGTAIGAVFDNWIRVMVYHLNREKNEYEFWTYLNKGFIPGFEYSKVKDMAGL